MQIPKVIHQTWRDNDVPARFRPWQRSWSEKNPGWSYRFWDDQQIEDLVRSQDITVQFLFASYKSQICRIDLARYLILQRFGGLYVDLDFECLRPIGDLLSEKSFVIGLEPAQHLDLQAQARSLSKLLCPSLIASVPGHAFWNHLLRYLWSARRHRNPLDATGPYAVTTAYNSYAAKHELELEPPSKIYPLSKWDRYTGRTGEVLSRDEARGAYAVHYWEGTWWRWEQQAGPAKSFAYKAESRRDLSRLALLFVQDDRWAEAAIIYRRLAKSSNHIDIVYKLGVCELRAGRTAEGLVALIRAHAQDPARMDIGDAIRTAVTRACGKPLKHLTPEGLCGAMAAVGTFDQVQEVRQAVARGRSPNPLDPT
jgi:hypothetical protein